tara:strand:- start:130 stop:315 length:186 start_codon:yes stop_codon:yes gene_type:complete
MSIEDDIKVSLGVIELAIQDILDKEEDPLRGGMISGAMSNVKLAITMGTIYKDAVDKFLEK